MNYCPKCKGNIIVFEAESKLWQFNLHLIGYECGQCHRAEVRIMIEGENKPIWHKVIQKGAWTK